MIKNYLKIAFRNLSRKKGFTLINILGLASGMAVCLLIVLFVKSELNFDTYHKRGDHIYRMVLDRKYPGRTNSYAIIPPSIGKAVKSEFPEVKEMVRVFDFTGDDGGFYIKIGDKTWEEKSVVMADSNFFQVFSSDIIAGDVKTPLDKPHSVVLNKSTAERLFGSPADAIGKTFLTDAPEDNVFQITAVCADWPANNHFRFNMLLSSTAQPFLREDNYINFAAATYFLLNPDASPKKLEAGFPSIVKKYVAGGVEKGFGMSLEQFEKAGNGYYYYLQPLYSIHLDSDLESELGVNGSRKGVTIFSIIAVFILALACINFINLSTARSVERAREVGLRKTFGSERKYLIAQFLLESVVISLISILVSIFLIAALLPLFNQLSGKELTIRYFLEPSQLSLIIVSSILIGIIAGIYPAFILSSFKPIMVLKGRFRSNLQGRWLRNGLVVFQFAISVVLIVCTIVVNRQMKYVMGDQLGFQKDHIVVINNTGSLGDQTNAFKTSLKRISGVENATRTTSLPGQQNYFGISYDVPGTDKTVTGRASFTDEDYASLLGLELKEGRFFNPSFTTDSFAVVLNEKAVHDLGLTNPVGTKVTTPEDFLNRPDGSKIEYTIIGVIKDFHYQSLHQKINPLIFNNAIRFGQASPVIAVKIKAADFSRSIAQVEKTWQQFVKDRPFSYDFLDQTLAKQYRSEQIMQKIFTVFSLLAIFIACIGLLGLAAYATQQRTREISVRKVLGANVGNIVTMLSADFLKLVLIATLIAFPVAWWMMSSWLNNFEYRTHLSISIFIVAAIAAVFVALFTISFQAIKAAMANPVKSLRTE
ncbi:ABC transporter permease [Pollutibacter soli]|uniref:ABC transporter permease n=1 Tax=Pollutibacter soli TaxID=3034157 RepID=UPI003013B633